MRIIQKKGQFSLQENQKNGTFNSLLVANFVGFDERWRRATVYLEILAEQDQFFDVRHVVSAAKMWSRGLSSLFYFYRAEHKFERGLGPEEELKSGKIWMFFCFF